MVESYIQTYYVLLMTINFTLTLVVMLAACLCCKRRVPKNELLGLEGMVKLKNPDEVVVVTTVERSESQVDLNVSTVSNADSEKRTSAAAHRSLPDIPVAEANGDNGSELYETVADKRLLDAQNRHEKSPTTRLKKQTSVSQHSSISQADDVSSPYSRVKNFPHDYAKVRTTEHPYAQLNAPSTSAAAAAAAAVAVASVDSSNSQLTECLNRSSQQSDSSQNQNVNGTGQVEIPAASAIAGMISASQDLPYMTPPINNQHFSGDSQDSSKGYTSISVREPLANILALQAVKPLQRTAPLTRDISDSHYATVSDDSDETYAAIEDPNGRLNACHVADIYTSGSETYAQIQPMQANASTIVVSVEINNVTSAVPPAPAGASEVLRTSISASNVTLESNKSASTPPGNKPTSSEQVTSTAVPIPPPVDNLRAQMHSRQASSSSNNSSSVGNLGSPKPEKRQANSPLPPTPTSKTQPGTSSSMGLTSARNSVISVIEGGVAPALDVATNTTTVAEKSPQKKSKSLSPSKDIEAMYAKVMKKSKLSRHSPTSQHNSPVFVRKHNDIGAMAATLCISPLDSAAAELIEPRNVSGATNEKSRVRSNSYGAKDHGYETIPADAARNIAGIENRKSDGYAHILRKERQQEETQTINETQNNTRATPSIEVPSESHESQHYETIASNIHDPGYETLTKPKLRGDAKSDKHASDNDPNYEVLLGLNETKGGLSDDGYAKVLEKKHLNIDEDSTDGYSKVRGEENEDVEGAVGGYSVIGAPAKADTNHNYASIGEARSEQALLIQDAESDHYARINETSSLENPGDDNSKARIPIPPELPINSPTSVNSSVLFCSNSSATSSNTITTTSTLSSRQTPSSSQYESFTGSDTDPNYESVSYLNHGRENPYERLQPDNSDTQLGSPLTPEDATLVTLNAIKKPVNGHTRLNSRESGTEVIVDDYFQV